MRKFNEANSYGWVVENWEAKEAYELACEYFGEEDINSQIVQAISDEELAACLAFIFRMNDFQEWDEYKANSANESLRRRTARRLMRNESTRRFARKKR